MSTTPRAFTSRPVRTIFGVCATFWSASVLATGGCSPEDSAALGQAGTASTYAGTGAGNVAGTPGAGGSVIPAGGSATGGSATTAGVSSGGVPNGSGGFATAGTGAGNTGGNASGGAGGSASKPCVDTPPPPDPEWPGATCQDWASETSECGADWFKNYCDVSCKRCTPAGGTGGNSSGGSSGTGGSSGAVDCSNAGLPNVTGGNGHATRYWDCCQPHCAQFDGNRCEKNGTTKTGNNQSACAGGGSFACYSEAPRAVTDCLSYGHIAKANPNCGQCYRIQFTGEGEHNANDPGSKLIKGKQMIVKVTNTGGDVGGSQFDLMVPGGGVGQFNACSNQWGTSDLGAQYGGFLTSCSGSHSQKKDCVRQQCMKIPAGAARDGCIWFVDWFQAADNPKFTSQQTECPF